MSIPRTTLEQWRVLQAIVDYGGYAQAADALHRSQSSVSYAVARLQEQAGVQLLVIEGRKARLTENGKTLLRNATELLDGAQRLEQLAKSLGEGREAEVRLVTDMAFPTAFLVEALTRFNRVADTTRVQLTEVVLSGAEEAIINQSADLVIGTQVPAGYLSNVLLDIEFVAVAHPHHPLHQLNRQVTPDDLRHHMQIVIRDSGSVSPRDEGWLGATQRWTVTSMETSLSLVDAGLGFAWLPRHLVRATLEQGSVWPLPLKEGQVRRVPLYLVFSCPDEVGPATQELAELIQSVVAESRNDERIAG